MPLFPLLLLPGDPWTGSWWLLALGWTLWARYREEVEEGGVGRGRGVLGGDAETMRTLMGGALA